MLTEPAELALLDELRAVGPIIEARARVGRRTTGARSREAAEFGPAVDRFFTDVFVMADDQTLRARAAAAA